jgi:lipoprotein-anchoring transpeptidase ErfK/SrfK
LKGRDTVRTFPIAVGMPKYPTPEGEFKIHQIDWNPDWTPPEGDWAKNEKYTPPSHTKNPMGRVRIIYQSPYSLHGTKDLASLREAESHGSVRLANKDVIELARLIMEESGQGKPTEWYDQVLRDSTKMQTINLTDSIRLTNRK